MSMTKGAVKLVVSKLSYPSSVEDNTSYNQIIWSPINLNLATKVPFRCKLVNFPPVLHSLLLSCEMNK